MAAAQRALGILDEDEQVLAAGAHRRDVAVAIVQLQAQRALVERDRAVEIGDGEVDGTEAQRVRQARRERRVFGGGAHGMILGRKGRAAALARQTQSSTSTMSRSGGLVYR